MSDDAAQAQRIKQLIDLACIARGWSRQALADHLDRDASRLVPEGGNPKLDYVMKLAEALEWPVGDVARAIRRDNSSQKASSTPTTKGATKSVLHQISAEAFAAGDYNRVIELSRQMFAMAASADERALALGNEAAAWSGLGRYTTCVEVANRGLAEDGVDSTRRVQLQLNIAQSLLFLAQFDLCLALADMIVRECESRVAVRRKQPWMALALFVRGTAQLRISARFSNPEETTSALRTAIYDLRVGADVARSLPLIAQNPDMRGLAGSCMAGVIQAEHRLGIISSSEALSRIDAHTEEATANPGNFWQEAAAWLSLAGAHIALRGLNGRDLQRRMAIYTERATAIAESLGNWAIKERIFSIQYLAHEAIKDTLPIEIGHILDRDDRALLAELMGRFPHIRHDGWRLLDTARLIN